MYGSKPYRLNASQPGDVHIWFYGFKLHLIVNHQGEIMAAKLTPGNVDDREPV
ncbi:transposase, partial [Xenorhabdus bovienii]|uniref:transposase n=1 Tax=Xenorhabdus bovienii TaxID=40576 RepID=UPI0030B9D6A8